MFAGHLGASLALASTERRVNVGVFIAAGLGLDLLLWAFVLLGWEVVTIPAAFASTHQPEFVFPYSHGLFASLVWSALVGGVALARDRMLPGRRWRAAALLAAAVFSHWLLDGLVHRPEMHLLGGSSPVVGLGLWQHMPTALTVEATVALGGLWLFGAGCSLSRGRRVGGTALSLLVLAFTILGMTIAPAPPSASAMAGSSLVTITVVCVIAYGIGR